MKDLFSINLGKKNVIMRESICLDCQFSCDSGCEVTCSYYSREILKLITKYTKKHNKALVMITHDPKVAEVADRIITIDDGNIVEDKKVTLCGVY